MNLSREEYEMGFLGMQAESREVGTERAIPPFLQKDGPKIRQEGKGTGERGENLEIQRILWALAVWMELLDILCFIFFGQICAFALATM